MHPTRYVSTCYTTTEDYRGYARGPCSGNPPSADDKNLERRLPRPSTGLQIRQASGQEGAGRLLCITGARDRTRSRKLHRHSVLETYFQKLSERAVSPRRATPGSVGYDLFAPVDFQLQPKEQKTIFINLAIVPPEGYYAQLMSKSGLTVLYELRSEGWSN